MYASVRKYKSSSPKEVIKRVNAEFVPMISKAPGFVSYHVIEGANEVLVSVSVFETQAGAEESNKMAAEWVKKSLSQFMAGPPEITAGAVAAYKTK